VGNGGIPINKVLEQRRSPGFLAICKFCFLFFGTVRNSFLLAVGMTTAVEEDEGPMVAARPPPWGLKLRQRPSFRAQRENYHKKSVFIISICVIRVICVHFFCDSLRHLWANPRQSFNFSACAFACAKKGHMMMRPFAFAFAFFLKPRTIPPLPLFKSP
jgi:hypothetical protein